MAVTGEENGAHEAERLGLMTKIVPRAELDREVSPCTELVLQRDVPGVNPCKEFFFDTVHLHPDNAYRYGVSLIANFNASRWSSILIT
jgi:enoyl-CoA hydratase/carnithine racemase